MEEFNASLIGMDKYSLCQNSRSLVQFGLSDKNTDNVPGISKLSPSLTGVDYSLCQSSRGLASIKLSAIRLWVLENSTLAGVHLCPSLIGVDKIGNLCQNIMSRKIENIIILTQSMYILIFTLQNPIWMLATLTKDIILTS